MERWLPIIRFPRYEVSSNGHVRNIDTQHEMSPWRGPNGYESVTLRNENSRSNQYVHRLVADAFYDGDHTDLEVNHIDGCKTNNFIGNLEWCTRKENAQHAIDNKLWTPYKLPPNPHEGRRVRIVETGEEFDSLTECAEHIGGFKTAVSACLQGKVHTHKGYHFEDI